jgi:hypothetical protein
MSDDGVGSEGMGTGSGGATWGGGASAAERGVATPASA